VSANENRCRRENNFRLLLPRAINAAKARYVCGAVALNTSFVLVHWSYPEATTTRNFPLRNASYSGNIASNIQDARKHLDFGFGRAGNFYTHQYTRARSLPRVNIDTHQYWALCVTTKNRAQ
jgi:hypothetical protein